MFDTFVVILIVAAAVFWLIRRFRRLSRGEVSCPGCNGECRLPCAEKEPLHREETPEPEKEAQGEQ